MHEDQHLIVGGKVGLGVLAAEGELADVAQVLLLAGDEQRRGSGVRRGGLLRKGRRGNRPRKDDKADESVTKDVKSIPSSYLEIADSTLRNSRDLRKVRKSLRNLRNHTGVAIPLLFE